MLAGAALAGSRDSGSTVSEGYSSTYSEASDWADDDSSSGSSNYGSYTEYVATYTDYGSHAKNHYSRPSYVNKGNSDYPYDYSYVPNNDSKLNGEDFIIPIVMFGSFVAVILFMENKKK